MAETVTITSRANMSFYLRPNVKIEAQAQTTVDRQHWDEWFAGHTDSPLIPFLDWPGKTEPAVHCGPISGR